MRYWTMKILRPVGVTFSPKPESSESQINTFADPGSEASIERFVRRSMAMAVISGIGLAITWQSRSGNLGACWGMTMLGILTGPQRFFSDGYAGTFRKT